MIATYPTLEIEIEIAIEIGIAIGIGIEIAIGIGEPMNCELSIDCMGQG
jgi:hypothetical protein